MIKNQRFIQFFLKDLSRSSLPFQQIIKFPLDPPKQINFKNFINFSSQTNSNINADQIKTQAEKEQLEVEDWGSREVLFKKRLREPSYSSFVLGCTFARVLDTCKIYGKSTPEERASIAPESRFYYVKERLDRLSVEDQRSFFEFVGRFDAFVEERAKKKFKSRGNLCPSLLSLERDRKGTAIDFLESGMEFEPVISDLMLRILDKENPDFKCLTRVADEEFAIGQFKSYGISAQGAQIAENLDSARRLCIQNLNRLRKMESYRIPIKDRVSLPKRRSLTKAKRNKSAFNHLRVIFVRILQTIRVYIESPLQARENVPKVSRFYYVHKRLRTWNQAELDKLWQYLDLIAVDSTYGLTEEQLGKSEKKRKILGSCNQTELFYILNRSEYGSLLKELLVEFFEKDNLDQHYFLNAQETEAEIGIFTQAPQKMNALTREYYNENMSKVRDKFQQFLDSSHPNQLSVKGPQPKSPKPLAK